MGKKGAAKNKNKKEQATVATPSMRDLGLGKLACLDDLQLSSIFRYLRGEDLSRGLARVSKVSQLQS